MKYTVGAKTQTVLNLLDGDGIMPLAISAGWQDNNGGEADGITSLAIRAGWQNNNGGEASVNCLNLTYDFYCPLCIKGLYLFSRRRHLF